MKRTVGLRDLLEALSGRERPLYGAEEDAVWQAHRARVIARALGVAIDDDVPDDKRAAWDQLRRLLCPPARHPFAEMLEASLLEVRFASLLAPVHEAFRALDAVYEAERTRLVGVLYGDVPEVDAARLEEVGLDVSLEPDWKSIFERL